MRDFCQSALNPIPNMCKSENNAIAVCLSSFGILQKDYRIGNDYIFIRMPKLQFDQIFKDSDSIKNARKCLLRSYFRKCIMACHFIAYLKSKINKSLEIASDPKIDGDAVALATIRRSARQIIRRPVPSQMQSPSPSTSTGKSRRAGGTKRQPPDGNDVQAKRSKLQQSPTSSNRYENNRHMPRFDSRKNAMRCKGGCEGKTHIYCADCKVHLCVFRERNCFEKYHTKPKGK